MNKKRRAERAEEDVKKVIKNVIDMVYGSYVPKNSEWDEVENFRFIDMQLDLMLALKAESKPNFYIRKESGDIALITEGLLKLKDTEEYYPVFDTERIKKVLEALANI